MYLHATKALVLTLLVSIYIYFTQWKLLEDLLKIQKL